MRTKQYVMNADFKVDIVSLMQHPIMKKPLGDLSESELCCAHDILRRLIDSSGDESFTLVDVLQISRLYYAWGELSYVMGEDPEKTIRHFRSSLRFLQKSGIDLSLAKWLELVSLRISEEL